MLSMHVVCSSSLFILVFLQHSISLYDCIYYILSVLLLMNIQVSSLEPQIIVPLLNILVHIFWCIYIHFFRTCNLQWNCWAVGCVYIQFQYILSSTFQSGCNNLYSLISREWGIRVPFVPTTLQHLLNIVSLIQLSW